MRRIPLAAIDAAVAARLGPGRVSGNAQPAVFSRQVAMYLAKMVGGWSTPQIGRFLQRSGPFAIRPCATPFGGLRCCAKRIRTLMAY
jgi:hypothetical protein